MGRHSNRTKSLSIRVGKSPESEVAVLGWSAAIVAFYVLSGMAALSVSYFFNLPLEGKAIGRFQQWKESR